MNRLSKILVASVLMLMAALVSWWFFDTFEYRVEEKNVGFRGEAGRNDYLAAEHFLKKFDMQIKSLPTILDLKQMPAVNDVLFIPTGRYDLSQLKIEELLDWVRHGGHLIVRARKASADTEKIHDELFSKLEVETHFDNKETLFSNYDPIVLDVEVNERIENKKVEFNRNIWMINAGKNKLSWKVESEQGSHLLEYSIGQGFITLLSDNRFMTNTYIDKHDHASFLYTMVHIDNTKRQLWIIRSDNMPSILSIISSKAPKVLLLFVLLVLVWLWYSTRRFGPLQKELKPARRNMSEHITSSGYFQWRNNNRSDLFFSVKQALIDQIAQTRPLWATLDNQELADKLGKIAGIDGQTVLSVLQTNSVEKEADFTQFIKILSSIRKKL